MDNNTNNETKKKEPGYIVGLWIARILWFFVIAFILAVGVALLASVIKLLMWYLALIF